MLPALDAAVAAALFSVSYALFAGGYRVAAAAALVIAVLFAYVSWSPFRLLSSAHAAAHNTAASARATALRHRRHTGTGLPCPYPDAWYACALSPHVPPGAVLDATVCGRALVVWRPRSGGPPSVLDAYCPHNGAHLAHGSTVGDGGTAGDCLRCPFHGWTFDVKGTVVSAGGDRAPAGVSARAWPVMERNGVISVWMSAAGHAPRVGGPAGGCAMGKGELTTADVERNGAAEGGGGGSGAPPAPRDIAALDAARDVARTPDDTPWFETPVFAPIDGPSPAFTFHGFSEHEVPALIYELPENGADIAHLTELHSAFVFAPLRRLLAHAWEGAWKPSETTPHLAELDITEHMTLCGVRLPNPVKVHITQAGISQVYLQFNVPAIGRVFIVETVTPVAPCTQRVLHAVHAERAVPRALAKLILWSLVQAYEQDVPVWAHKRYEPKPKLTLRDAAVGEFRRWAKQFYRDARAISFADAMRAHTGKVLGYAQDGLLEW